MNIPNLILDFDSTIIKLEGLDEVASISLKHNPNQSKILNEIKYITNLGMKGEISFQESLSRRLELIKINQEMINQVVELLKSNISDSILKNKDFFNLNKANIYVISGGFKEWVEPVSIVLGIKPENIFANEFNFDKNGAVLNHKIDNPLSKSMGKVNVVKSLNLEGTKIMIGDGYTDYEVKKMGEADIFVSYNENVTREEINKLADFKISSFDEFITILNQLEIVTISS